MRNQYMYVGSWTPRYDEDNNAGIQVFRHSMESNKWEKIQTVRTGFSVGWLKVDKEKKLLYVCLETKKYFGDEAGGCIQWYRINETTGELTLVNTSNSYGAYPIDMKWKPDYCLVLNHGSNLSKSCETYRTEDGVIKTRFVEDSANLVLFARDSEGNLSEVRDYYPITGRGSIPFFQDEASPHSLFCQEDKGRYFVPERGTDKISYFEVNSQELKIEKQGEVLTSKEYGPRNVVVDTSSGCCYVISEIWPKLTCYRQTGDKSFDNVWEQPTVSKAELEMYAQAKNRFDYPHPVDIALSENGRFLYTLTRTSNTLGIFSLNAAGGDVGKVDYITLDGDNPRQMLLDGNFMYIVFHGSSKIQMLVLNEEDGKIVSQEDCLCDLSRVAVMDMYSPD